MTTGEKIKALRKSQGMTQEQLANKILVSRRTIIDWENEKYSPQVENLRAICEAFKLSLDYFLDSDKAIDSKVDKEATKAKPAKEEIRNSIFLGDKNELSKNLKEYAKANNLNWYYDSYRYFSFLALALIIPGICLANSTIGLILVALGIVLFIVLIYLGRYLKNNNRVKLMNLIHNETKSKGTPLALLHRIYYNSTNDRLIITNQDNVVVDVANSSIRSIILGINNNIINGIITAKLPKLVALFTIRIYYTDGNHSDIALLAYDEKLDKSLINVNNIVIVEALNKLKIKYENINKLS